MTQGLANCLLIYLCTFLHHILWNFTFPTRLDQVQNSALQPKHLQVKTGFEPVTFCVLSRCDNHYTTRPVLLSISCELWNCLISCLRLYYPYVFMEAGSWHMLRKWDLNDRCQSGLLSTIKHSTTKPQQYIIIIGLLHNHWFFD